MCGSAIIDSRLETLVVAMGLEKQINILRAHTVRTGDIAIQHHLKMCIDHASVISYLHINTIRALFQRGFKCGALQMLWY